MVGTRSTRSRPAAADDPLVELPVTKRKPPTDKKRRGKVVDPPVIKGSPKKEDDRLMDMQVDGISDKMEVDSEAIDVEAADSALGGADKAIDGDKPVNTETPMLGVDSAMHTGGGTDGGARSIAQEASPKTPTVPPSPEDANVPTGPRDLPYDTPLHIRTPGKRPLVPSEYHDGCATTAGYSEVEIRRSSRKRLVPRPGEEPYSQTPPEDSVLEKAISQTPPEGSAPEIAMSPADGIDDEIIDDDSDWEEEYLMTDPKSIYGSNLHHFFGPTAWNKLSDADKEHLMKYLPECDKVYEATSDVTDPTLPKAELVDGFWENPQLAARISQVEYDIAEGKYTDANQKAVKEARKRAEAGEFDKFKENKFEAFWGQKQRVEYNVVAGDTSAVKLQTLVKHSALRVGDVFSLRRTFGTRAKGSGGVTVEKDATLTAVDPDDFSLTFSYPPGRLQVSSDNRPDKTISGVVSMTALESLLCREDGRPPSKLPNGNAFKTFRIKRNEQDIGSLFDVRMEFHSRYLSPKT